MPNVDETAPTEDRPAITAWTPEQAVPALEAYLFPASPADQTEAAEPAVEAEAPAEAETAPEAAAVPEESEPAVAEGESAEPAEEAPPEPAQPRTWRVKLPDAEEEVTEDELVRGYQRQADYTRKTMALSDERKAFEAEAAAVRAERQRYASALVQLDQALEATGLQDPGPDYWSKLQTADPARYAAEKIALAEYREQAARVRAERDAAIAKVQQDEAEALKQRLADERRKLLEAVPEWTDAEKARTEAQALTAYAKARGFTEQDVSLITDARLMLILRDAARYHALQQAKPQAQRAVESKIKPAKPGASASVKPKPTKADTLASQLRRSGRVDDAAKLFEQFV